MCRRRCCRSVGVEMSSLTLAVVQEMMDRLPPAPPDQELHYHPESRTLPGFQRIEKENRGPFGRYLMPMIEAQYVPIGKMVMFTYEMVGRCRVVKETAIVDLS